jgi:hypothetical protein
MRLRQADQNSLFWGFGLNGGSLIVAGRKDGGLPDRP